MTERIRISAKKLGELALPSFCPRCFWLKLKLNNKLPFQIFPGIFSSIDTYTKNIIHKWFDNNNSAPHWLCDLGEITGYVNPPHYSKFSIVDNNNDIVFTGIPDGIFTKADGSFVIVDYKTAKYTKAQGSLYPMYDIQLNGYALIGNENGFYPVSDIALIYMEPLTDKEKVVYDDKYRDDGFVLGFTSKIHKVNLNPAKIYPLLAQVREIYETPSLPGSRTFCKDCDSVEKIAKLLSKTFDFD